MTTINIKKRNEFNDYSKSNKKVKLENSQQEKEDEPEEQISFVAENNNINVSKNNNKQRYKLDAPEIVDSSLNIGTHLMIHEDNYVESLIEEEDEADSLSIDSSEERNLVITEEIVDDSLFLEGDTTNETLTGSSILDRTETSECSIPLSTNSLKISKVGSETRDEVENDKKRLISKYGVDINTGKNSFTISPVLKKSVKSYTPPETFENVMSSSTDSAIACVLNDVDVSDREFFSGEESSGDESSETNRGLEIIRKIRPSIGLSTYKPATISAANHKKDKKNINGNEMASSGINTVAISKLPSNQCLNGKSKSIILKTDLPTYSQLPSYQKSSERSSIMTSIQKLMNPNSNHSEDKELQTPRRKTSITSENDATSLEDKVFVFQPPTPLGQSKPPALIIKAKSMADVQKYLNSKNVNVNSKESITSSDEILRKNSTDNSEEGGKEKDETVDLRISSASSKPNDDLHTISSTSDITKKYRKVTPAPAFKISHVTSKFKDKDKTSPVYVSGKANCPRIESSIPLFEDPSLEELNHNNSESPQKENKSSNDISAKDSSPVNDLNSSNIESLKDNLNNLSKSVKFKLLKTYANPKKKCKTEKLDEAEQNVSIKSSTSNDKPIDKNQNDSILGLELENFVDIKEEIIDENEHDDMAYQSDPLCPENSSDPLSTVILTPNSTVFSRSSSSPENTITIKPISKLGSSSTYANKPGFVSTSQRSSVMTVSKSQQGGSPIYLDFNATTPVDKNVAQLISKTLMDGWSNPSSSYKSGCDVKGNISVARKQVSQMIKTSMENIIFTSGGTESNNLAITSAVRHYHRWLEKGCRPSKREQLKRPHIITSNVEHDSVRKTLDSLIDCDVTVVPWNSPVQDFINAIKPQTCLITVMLANNETGIVLPVQPISVILSTNVEKTRKALGFFNILLHTDASQCIGKMVVSVEDMRVDYMSFTGHKFYGPRMGVLYVRADSKGWLPVYPMLYGGMQERGLRPGTENTPYIAGMGLACKLVSDQLNTYVCHMKAMSYFLVRSLKKHFGIYVKINCIQNCLKDAEECARISNTPLPECSTIYPKLPNTVSVAFYFEDITADDLMKHCPSVLCSRGSACHASSPQDYQNSVLSKFQVCEFHAARTLRLSVGRETNEAEVERAVFNLKIAANNIIGAGFKKQNFSLS